MSARILIVDDHPEVKTALRAMLEDSGAQVVGDASDGATAIGLAGELQPDVVVLDFSMPDMDGVEAGTEIHRLCPAAELIILSVYEPGENAERAEAAGIRHWIPKSLPPEVLLGVLSDIAGSAGANEAIQA